MAECLGRAKQTPRRALRAFALHQAPENRTPPAASRAGRARSRPLQSRLRDRPSRGHEDEVRVRWLQEARRPETSRLQPQSSRGRYARADPAAQTLAVDATAPPSEKYPSSATTCR